MAAFEKPCSAFAKTADAEFCLNGFFVNPACRGATASVPMCMDEDWCARRFPETGAPTMERVEYIRRLAPPRQGERG